MKPSAFERGLLIGGGEGATNRAWREKEHAVVLTVYLVSVGGGYIATRETLLVQGMKADEGGVHPRMLAVGTALPLTQPPSSVYPSFLSRQGFVSPPS